MSKAANLLEISAAVTERGQTTVPAAIRKLLKLGKRDSIVFRGLSDGTVLITRNDGMGANEDPLISGFLTFLAKDMTNRPDRIRPLMPDRLARARALVEGVHVDVDAPLPDDEE